MILIFLFTILAIVAYIDVIIEISIDCCRHIMSKMEAAFQLAVLSVYTFSIIILLFLLTEYV